MVLVIGINFCMFIIEGYDYFKVMSYLDVLCDYKLVGKKVVIVGVGGIGFDVVEFLVEYEYLVKDKEKWLVYWGIDKDYVVLGVLKEKVIEFLDCEVYLL